ARALSGLEQGAAPAVRRTTELPEHSEAWQGCKERGGSRGCRAQALCLLLLPRFFTATASRQTLCLRPQIRRDNPLNLSILLSGGKETNQDSPSSGERRGKSPALNPRPLRARELYRPEGALPPGRGRGPGAF